MNATDELISTVLERDVAQLTAVQVQSELERLEQMIAQLRQQIAAERSEASTRGTLETAVASQRARVEQLTAQLTPQKQRAKQRKQEVDEWKWWFSNLPLARQPDNLPKLMGEIEWRAAELAALTAAISAADVALAEAEGALAQAQHRLQLFDASVFDRPEENDPRLVALQNVHQSLQAVANPADAKGDTYVD